MKTKIIITLTLIIIVITRIIIFLKPKKISLETKYYGQSSITKITKDEYEELKQKKESFAIFIYEPACPTSSNFEKIVNEFVNESQISIYKLAFSDIKNTDIESCLKYYPSFIIYNKGNIIAYLEADKKEDLACYKSKEEFKSWFTKYVVIK